MRSDQLHYLVVSYDIVDDRRRTRVAEILEAYGKRVQKSVFECRLDDQKILEMSQRIESEIDLVEDSVRYYFLCQRCRALIRVPGVGTTTEVEDVVVV